MRAIARYGDGAAGHLGSTALTVLLLTGCYTTQHNVKLGQLETTYPVSASAEYVASGVIVKEDDYQVVESFSFDKTLEAPRHEETTTTLSIEAQLDEFVKQHQGDAVTNLSVVATDYDSGSHVTAASWKTAGWSLGLGGATLLVLGTLGGEDSTTLYAAGGVLVGVGVAFNLISYAANDPAVWTLHVEGQVVKSKTVPQPQAHLQSDALPQPTWREPTPVTRSERQPSVPPMLASANLLEVTW